MRDDIPIPKEKEPALSGSLAGYTLETRHMQNGFTMDVYIKGAHGLTCEQTEDGIVCDDECEVEDHQSMGTQELIADDLVEVEEPITRRWFKVDWEMIRVSVRRTFKNGRSRQSDVVFSYETWHKGRTWTKWGARRQMSKYGVGRQMKKLVS